MRSSAIYCTKELLGRNSQHLAIIELSVQNMRDSGEMLSKDRYETTSGFFVIPLFSQLREEKNYWERRN
jgi:hypothetical protein